MLLSSQQQYSPASRLDWDTANDSLPFDPNRKVDCCCVSWFIKLARRDMFVVCSLIFCWLLRWTYLLLTCYWFMRRGCHDEAALKHESSLVKKSSEVMTQRYTIYATNNFSWKDRGKLNNLLKPSLETERKKELLALGKVSCYTKCNIVLPFAIFYNTQESGTSSQA